MESSGNGVRRTGSQGRDYEERLRELGHTTLVERRHQLAMQQVHRILVGKDKVKSKTWFKMASDMERVTRAAADPSTVSRSEKELSAGKLELNSTGTEAGHHCEGISQRLQETQRPDDDQISRCGVHDV